MMAYEPEDYVPRLGRDVAGLALWCALTTALAAAGASAPVGIQSDAGARFRQAAFTCPTAWAGAAAAGISCRVAAVRYGERGRS
jgi:hypothetical protein